MKYNSKFVRHKTNSSLKQIKNYIDKGLLKQIEINDKLEMNEKEITTLYKIKFLKQIGFTLDEMKIIMENLQEEELFEIFFTFFEKEKELIINFEKNLNLYLSYKKLIIDRNTFGYFTSETLAKGIMFDLYNYRIQWYEDSQLKITLKENRKMLFEAFNNFINYDSNKNLIICFENLNKFLISNIQKYSKLHFICMIKWWTTEPRYVKQIKNKLNFNYGPELFEQALLWVTKN